MKNNKQIKQFAYYIRFGTEAQAQEFKGGVNIVKKAKKRKR